jgi:hypothetical protein
VCQPSLNQVKDLGFEILGFATQPNKYQVEVTEDDNVEVVGSVLVTAASKVCYLLICSEKL